MNNHPFRSLSENEINQLLHQGCISEDWSSVSVRDGFLPERVRNTHFAGSVRLGVFRGTVRRGAGAEAPSGIYGAHIIDCTIGDNVRISNIGVHLASYDIGDDVRIENVGLMEVSTDAAFGNGVEVEVLNEGGGREVILFNELDAQFAYMMCLHRYHPILVEKLTTIAKQAAQSAVSNRGEIGSGTCIVNTDSLKNVNVGEYAIVDGAIQLVNGTILSSHDAPTTIGAGVLATDFIIGESTVVDGGAVISRSYIGQACRIGKQFSSEGSLFFANCEGFHGEACSIFAGPYSVTHHKSTLLIAGLFSFYNAGSGTNQSNHLYKLGPVHEGKLERGSKTGSFSYMMWPCRIGPFSVVLGKHTRTFDTADFPFSHIEAMPDGRCVMIPGFNLNTVGTVRDGAKWPKRDRRKGTTRRDRISFDVLSPYTVGRMLKGSAILKQLQEETPRTVDTVTVKGAEIKRVLLRRGQRYYQTGIKVYLLEKFTTHVENAVRDKKDIISVFQVNPDAVFDEEWIDLGGLMMPRRRLGSLHAQIESGEIKNLAGLHSALDEIQSQYAADEWAWIKWAVQKTFQVNLDTISLPQIVKLLDEYLAVRTKFLKSILLDSSKEFDENVQTGFGIDGTEADIETDFQTVRGTYENNAFVRQIKQELVRISERVEQIKEQI